MLAIDWIGGGVGLGMVGIIAVCLAVSLHRDKTRQR